MNEQLGSLFPRKWIVEVNPPAIVEIYLDWLLHELDAYAEEKWPILKVIRGWRRSEVIAFLEAMPDWTDGILNTNMS